MDGKTNKNMLLHETGLKPVFLSTGIVSSIGGIARFRTMADMKGTIQDSQDAFDNALTNAKNRQAAIGGMSSSDKHATSQPGLSY